MREHGVLDRCMLIFDEAYRLAHKKKDYHPEAIDKTADLIRRFAQDYHEKSEENYIFPKFKEANKLVELVDVLTQQHVAGKKLINQIRASIQSNDEEKDKLVIKNIHLFNSLYRPHKAQEDTVLFPEFRTVVSKKEFDKMGEKFEEEEHKLFGEDGFEKIVKEVEDIEKEYGINDLSKFTPQE